jgi:hypothetical protein
MTNPFTLMLRIPDAGYTAPQSRAETAHDLAAGHRGDPPQACPPRPRLRRSPGSCAATRTGWRRPQPRCVWVHQICRHWV